MSYEQTKLGATNLLKLQPPTHRDVWRVATFCLVSTVALAGTLAAGSLKAAEFIPIGTTNYSLVEAVSEDGSVVAGKFAVSGDREAFRWTEDTGKVRLGFLPGKNSSQLSGNSPGMSGDGSTIVGHSFNYDGISSPYGYEAFIHTDLDGMRGLGHLPGGSESHAIATSFDGAVVVGLDVLDGYIEAYRWTESEGMVGMGFLPGVAYSVAYDISADGSIIVGISGDDPFLRETFIWTAATGMQGIGLSGRWQPTVSADGSIVGGSAFITSQSNTEAFLWTEDTGATELGWLAGTAEDDGTNMSAVTGISGNGAVVGVSGATRNNRRGFIWTEESGMQDLKQVLTDQYGLGASLEGWTLRAPQDISANGQYIVGNGYNPNGDNVGWLVRLDAPFNVSADFDNDSDVDGFDFLKWQRGDVSSPPSAEDLALWETQFGTPISLSSADFDNDSDVDGFDFLKWQRGDVSSPPSAEDLALWETQFGTPISLSSAASIPEPSSIALAALGLLSLLSHRRGAGR